MTGTEWDGTGEADNESMNVGSRRRKGGTEGQRERGRKKKWEITEREREREKEREREGHKGERKRHHHSSRIRMSKMKKRSRDLKDEGEKIDREEDERGAMQKKERRGGSGVKKVKRDKTEVKVKSEKDEKKLTVRPSSASGADKKEKKSLDIDKQIEKIDKIESNDDAKSRVIYMGHLPHGFYEMELRSFFLQFGTVTNVKVSRSKKTARSKGYAFIEFESEEVAEIVRRTINGYMMFGQVLKCDVVNKTEIHPDLFKGCKKKFRKIPWRKIAAEFHDKQLSSSEIETRTKRLIRGENKRRKKIAEAGIDYEFKGYKSEKNIVPKSATKPSGKSKKKAQ